MTRTCFEYHQETSYDRNRMGGHFLDWANQPNVFKTYEGREPVGLPREVELPRRRLFSLLLDRGPEGLSQGMDLESLSKVLLLTNTVTARARSQEGDFYFRSAASAGALYPTEIYTSTHGVKGLADGLYHFAIHSHGLVPLRTGDFGAAVLEAAGAEDKAPPVVVFFLTAIFFRSAWKYRARAYRYHLMDTGHVEENLVLPLKALGLPYRVSYDFDDGQVNRLLGLDEGKEVALTLVFLKGPGETAAQGGVEIDELPEPILKASRVSAKEVDYPAIRQIHEAGNRRLRMPPHPALSPNPRERDLLAKEMVGELGITPRNWSPVETAGSWPEIIDYPDAVFRRRSRRNFVKNALSKEAMKAFLRSVCRSDGPAYDQSIAVGFLVGQAEDMDPGFYLLDRERESWALVSSGQLMARSTSICLDQAWLVNAGVHFLFLSNLEVLEKTWGPRGYRYAMLTAGRLGQRIYVAAEAMGLGCCGIGAFYDWEASGLLGLNEGSRLLYLVAVGEVKENQ